MLWSNAGLITGEPGGGNIQLFEKNFINHHAFILLDHIVSRKLKALNIRLKSQGGTNQFDIKRLK